MDLTDERLAALLRPLIPENFADAAIAYLDTRPRAAGERIELGNRACLMPYPGYFLFVDLMPAANWGHPALCVFLSETGARVQAADAEFPPFFGDLPPHYRRLLL